MTKVAAPLTPAQRGRGEPGTDLGHEALASWILPFFHPTASGSC
jgi:hypothetical protein